MATEVETPLAALYEADETAWLDRMAELAAARRAAELDWPHLAEYLADMARRDRREVSDRLAVLLVHWLKWEHQPARRSASWRGTILEQRRKLRRLLESGTLRNHASSVLDDVYDEARADTATETGLPVTTFPAACPWTVDDLLTGAPAGFAG